MNCKYNIKLEVGVGRKNCYDICIEYCMLNKSKYCILNKSLEKLHGFLLSGNTVVTFSSPNIDFVYMQPWFTPPSSACCTWQYVRSNYMPCDGIHHSQGSQDFTFPVLTLRFMNVIVW